MPEKAVAQAGGPVLRGLDPHPGARQRQGRRDVDIGPGDAGDGEAYRAEAAAVMAGIEQIECQLRHREIAFPDFAEPHERRRRSEEHTSELQSLMRISYAVFCLK